MYELGVIHGRFQLLHNDHLRYLLAGKQRCRHLVVGITNPDPVHTREDAADPARSRQESNPFSYYQRYCMVRSALAEQGFRDDISIVPFPVNSPELYRYYVPLEAVFFLTIYDEWGRKKRKMFHDAGLATEVLWERPLEKKGLSATSVRRKIVGGQPWKHLVPESVCLLLEQRGWLNILLTAGLPALIKMSAE